FSRRDFIKVAGTTAGVAVAAGYSPFSYAQNEKVHVACIGTGGQGGFHIRHGLNQNPDMEIVAVCDVYKPHLEAAWGLASGAADNDGKPQREVKQYMDYRKLLDEMGNDIDAVVIATPLHQHYHIVMDCLDAGKHVFCEKTLAYDLEQVRNLVTKTHDSGKILQVGHQRRYNPEYNKCVWLARGSGERASEVGRINHVSAHWHRNNDWRRPVPQDYVLSEEEKQWIDDLEKHINWRLYKDRSRGGLITELATHQLDIANWFLGSMPSRVTAYGGIDYWRDGRDVHDNIVMIYEYDIERTDPSFAVIPPRNSEQRRAELGRPYTVRFTYASICANAYREYGEWIHGDRGSFLTTEQKGCMFYPEPAAAGGKWNVDVDTSANATDAAKAITSGETREFKPEDFLGMKVNVFDDTKKLFDNPAVVDRMQFTAFANDIRNGGTPKANQIVGLMSAVCGFAAIESMDRGGVTVDINPADYAFDFETPDPFRFDFFEDPKFVNKEQAGA
ncbi:MAG: Gfo/Idh/MocA family oxidoreductase, partial [Candidatus Hydrogenedentales bacterium]